MISIVMYHYVRDLKNSKYPKIHGLDVADFERQLEFFSKNFEFITPKKLKEACTGALSLDDYKDYILLSFDDGYIDHYDYVFPSLKKYGIKAIFSMPAKIIAEHKVLDVNKIHFVLAAIDENIIVENIKSYLAKVRGVGIIPSFEQLYTEYAKPNRFDTADTIFVKRVLQHALPELARNELTDELFRKYVSNDEKAFCSKLYMSLDQINEMKTAGMEFGLHGYEHYWFEKLNEETVKSDIDKALRVFNGVIDKGDWTFVYPFGSANESVISIAREKGCSMGLSTEVRCVDVRSDSVYQLPRLDTNDFPPKSENYKMLMEGKQ